MFRGFVYVPDATHGGWWRAESRLDLEIAGNLACVAPGQTTSEIGNPDDVSCLSRNIADRAKI